jgi:hypothetical protein
VNYLLLARVIQEVTKHLSVKKNELINRGEREDRNEERRNESKKGRKNQKK